MLEYDVFLQIILPHENMLSCEPDIKAHLNPFCSVSPELQWLVAYWIKKRP